MSSAQTDTDTGDDLLRCDPDVGELLVRNTNTGVVSDARVTDKGIVREIDGPASFSSGTYEIAHTNPDKYVALSRHNTRSTYHTNECQSIKRGANSKRKLVPIKLALGFYEVEECTYCATKEDLPKEELAQFVTHIHEV